MIAPGTPTSLSQSKVTLNAESPAVKGVMVVIHSSRYAGFPNFPCKPFSTEREKETKIFKAFDLFIPANENDVHL